MKLKVKRLLLLIAMLCAMSGASANDYDFEVDGIYFKMISLNDLTCRVVKKDNNFKYSGDVVIPAQVKYGNRNITVVELEDGVFSKCDDLMGITIPNTISTIKISMFQSCNKLERVKFEDCETTLELEEDGSSIVFNKSPIKTLYIGRNLSYSPFENKTTIKEVEIGNLVTELPCFLGCKGIKSITIPNTITKIGNTAFGNCSGLTSITIPNSVTEIGAYAFLNCNSLTSITIPNSVTKIGWDVFAGCSGLTSITIPNSVTEIGGEAFGWCRSLTSITIPNSVSKIGVNVVRDCDALTSFYCFATTPPTINDKYGNTTFTTNQIMALNVYVPKESLADYQKADGWKDFWNLQGFDPTAVDGIEADEDNSPKAYYDLQGRKSDAPRRGLNIVKGKKILVK